MDALVQRSISLVEAKKKPSVPWKVDIPYSQPYYVRSAIGRSTNDEWSPVKESTKPAMHRDGVEQLAVYSWNIDFMLPFPDARMSACVRHLQGLIEKQPSDIANVVFLAECVESDLSLIASDPWVRSNFSLTDLNSDSWGNNHYGTTTLIDRRLQIKDVFRVHFSKTRMERDGLFVDVHFGSENQILRLCNTHLESLALEPPYRPPQMKVCAEFLHAPDVTASILAGDLNAIQDFDKQLHSDNNLKDAYLELGGQEDDAMGGHTWGQQAATVQRERFGTSRMDKVYYCGELRLKSFERFGADIEVENDNERAELVKLGFDRPWITDHLGVKAVFDATDSQTTAKLV